MGAVLRVAQGQCGGAGIMRRDEQFKFPPLPGDRHPSSGHALPDLSPHRRVPARQPQRGPDRALPPGPSRSARPPFPVAGPGDPHHRPMPRRASSGSGRPRSGAGPEDAGGGDGTSGQRITGSAWPVCGKAPMLTSHTDAQGHHISDQTRGGARRQEPPGRTERGLPSGLSQAASTAAPQPAPAEHKKQNGTIGAPMPDAKSSAVSANSRQSVRGPDSTDYLHSHSG